MSVHSRVLVVDDNVELAEDLGEVLELAGADVDLARDGREAVDRLGTTHYQLVLTDMRMPRLSGLEVCRTARGTDPATPVVLMTAYSHDEQLAKARTCGALRVMEKPVDLDELTRIYEHIASSSVA